MGKGFKGLSVRHLLMVSIALNVGLLLKLAYERESNLGGTEQIFHGFCAEDQQQQKETFFSSSSSPSMAAAAAEKAIDSILPAVSELHGHDDGRVINLDHGDPTMFERHWQQAGDKTTVVIPGWQSMSYFSDASNLCWFLERGFAKEVIRLHKIVGNAVTEGRHIVVGTGSTQLFQAALYGLSSSSGAGEPISVVSATPYYSFYRQVVEYMKSGLYQWVGDASSFNEDKPFIELITSPNNPDGFMRQPVVNRSGGMLIHDFAYYWPHYTPITSPADHNIMLFTVSKSTGHAGMRIGWAVVKDEEVAKRMTKFIELNSIGVSKDSQLRAAKILQAVSDSREQGGDVKESGDFFEINYRIIAERWDQLREAVKRSGLFSTPEFPAAFCKYSNRTFRTQPAFAWLKCEREIDDCESFLRSHKILSRSGTHFGMSPKYVRISMLDRDVNYHLFIKRLLEMRL